MENLQWSRPPEVDHGRSIEGFVAASIYAAIRIHNFPRVLEEVVEVAMIPSPLRAPVPGDDSSIDFSRVKIEVFTSHG